MKKITIITKIAESNINDDILKEIYLEYCNKYNKKNYISSLIKHKNTLNDDYFYVHNFDFNNNPNLATYVKYGTLDNKMYIMKNNVYIEYHKVYDYEINNTILLEFIVRLNSVELEIIESEI